MNPAAILSTLSGLAALVLSIVFYFKASGVQRLGSELQKRQQQAQEKQQAMMVQQQTFQAQQQRINQGVQLAQQVGPAVLNDLGVLARDNQNENIKKLLEKYGVTLAAPAAGTEAPKPAKP
jgi:hypothetical protein